MRTYKKREVSRVVTEKILSTLTCDLCGRPNCGEEKDEWELAERNHTTVTIKYESLTFGYEGDGESERISFDICPGCFKDKLIPFVRQNSSVPDWKPYHEENYW
jgi:hypothetical protein